MPGFPRPTPFWIGLGCWLLALTILGQVHDAGWTAGDKLVLTYYFYWYDIYTGQHFIDPDGSDALTDHPPDAYLADYSYTQVSWHQQELLDIMAAGIDIVLPVYWGDRYDTSWSQGGLPPLVAAEDALTQAGKTPPKIGMFYDTTALKIEYGSPPDLTTLSGKALFYGMIKDFFSLLPARVWALIDGHPLVVLYGANWVSAYDQGTFDYAAQHFQADFGVTPYFIREVSWQNIATFGTYQWGAALGGPTVFGAVGSVGPGYDDSAVYGRSQHSFRDRECGNFYNAGWDQIVSSGPSLVLVETWDEFHEATDVAASREYGHRYIDLTALNAVRWKATDYGGAPVVWLERFP